MGAVNIISQPVCLLTHLKEERALNTTQTVYCPVMLEFNCAHVFTAVSEEAEAELKTGNYPSAHKAHKMPSHTLSLMLHSPCLCHPRRRAACHPRPKCLHRHAPACGPGPSSWGPERRGRISRVDRRPIKKLRLYHYITAC